MSQRVAEIMNPKLLYIRDGDRVALSRAKILEFGVTAVPVLDEDHRPTGVVSLRDIARGGDVHPTSPALCVRGDATVEEGALTLAESGTHHLVVVDDDGVAIGMVAAIDFVRSLVGLPARHPDAFAEY
jgi:CBS domain-containing protein